MAPPISISADEVNYLVYRYLAESGFRHSVFAFENESQIARRLDGFRAYNVRPGHLITLLVKALQMTLVELHMDDDGTERDCDAALSLLAPHTCILPEKRARKQPAATADASSTKMEVDGDPPRSAASSAKKEKKKQQRQRDKQRKRAQQQQQKESPAKPIIPEDGESMDVDEIDHDDEEDAIVQVQVTGNSSEVIPATDPVITLQSTDERYYVSAWNPVHSNLLASGSLDSIVALWQLPNTNGRITDPNLIKHPSDLPGNQVTCIAWSPNGEYLATGTKDAKTRIFTRKGNLVLTFSHGAEKNSNPVFALAFNPDSTLLASGCASGTIIVWDVRQDAEKYSSSAHTGAVMAFDWYNHHLLASGASDSTIRLSDVNKGSQTCWSGHTADVNDIKWDPSRKYLASCSDDCTVCIWSRERPGSEPVAVLRGHEKPVLTIDWNPKPPNNVPQLASAGTDSSVRIWDVLSGTCIFRMTRYVNMHCVLSYSPDGKYIACGSDDQYLFVWTSSAQLVKTFYGHGDILDLRFSPKGDRMAVCFGTSKLAVLPLAL